jgi:8-oxo-dGTP pyrophosphatase MutT (NUDIX family)
MAGIMFTDGKFVLAGYNPKKCHISGIGGKAEEGETPIQTAIRETLEELFELETIPEELKTVLYENLTFDTLFFTSDYTTFVMDFRYDLEVFFEVISKFDVRSRVYSTIPQTLEQLLMTRIVVPEAELSHLMLIPCVYNIGLDENFVQDIYTFKNCERSIR